jgi:hypothetical protein
MKDGDTDGKGRRTSGNSSEPAIQVICLVCLVLQPLAKCVEASADSRRVPFDALRHGLQRAAKD